MRCKYAIRSVMCSLTLLLGVSAWADTATTAPATPATPTTKRSLISQLRKAHELLTRADHDYDGHRAKAAEEVHLAIKEVEGKHTAKAGAKKGVKEGAHHEAQGTSDEQVKEALSILESVSSEIGTKHPKAESNVKNAIAEINTALKIK